MQSLLLNFVKNCYCWEGNRCQNCQNILQAIAKNPTHLAPVPTEKYQDIVTQLRKQN
ncbi:MAG: hypothetical protein RSE13_19600 [Planktothrix sp. GU0601_MAG3]|nr:MAG: hypothetical protein RSE13_19600 [Planktothrix sp. GU0601_MAG3]